MTAIVIPARYASTRYPGKPLAELRGATGVRKSLIRRAWDAAMAVPGIDSVHVATDDDRIKDHAEGFGASVIMTDPGCRNGTERVAQAVERAGLTDDIIVNLQGDAPLTPAEFITALVSGLQAAAECVVATPVLRCDAETLSNFRADRAAGRVGGTTAVFDTARRALYFSKEVIPFTDQTYGVGDVIPVWHHVGIYAYRRAALADYATAPMGTLEVLEGLEQLRFLEAGLPIACIEVEARGRVFWELNNPVDIDRIEAVLQREGQP